MRLSILLIALALPTAAIAASSCEVRLNQPVRNCPSVTLGPEDCTEDLVGKVGKRLTVPATVHFMAGGRSYYCPSHEGCVDLESVTFDRCVLKYVPRYPQESKDYLGHVIVQ